MGKVNDENFLRFSRLGYRDSKPLAIFRTLLEYSINFVLSSCRILEMEEVYKLELLNYYDFRILH